ncbi:MAG: hypothetical protein HY901_07755, partial [Deltaproteobacteria bacterium]|nr:hypothetical protein [Deltaproteobacteria bacterium]
MTAPTTRATLLLAALAACTPAQAPDAKLALGRVDVACQPRAGGVGARCDVAADLTVGGAAWAQAVLSVREGDRLVQQVVVPVENGRGALRLKDV